MKNERPNGKLQGDSRPMKDNGGSTAGPDFTKSLGGKSMEDLKRGYCKEGRITGATKSDKGFA
jgi:hypothetical protein